MSGHPKVARADHDILDVIRQRWSPRAFDASRDIAREDLLRLFEAARWAPSSFNEQPWRFVLTCRSRSPEQFAAVLASLTVKNQAWARSVPALVLVAVHTRITRLDVENTHAWYDAGHAVALLTVQATAMGLSIRQMQGFNPAIAREACGVPGSFEPAVVMAIGYAGDPDALEIEGHREAERTPRDRRRIDEFVFEDVWGREIAR